MKAEIIVKMAKPQACKECPWRLSNRGKRPDPGGWYTKSNLHRLWSGLRRGKSMTCHRTDDRMNELSGPCEVAPGTSPHECTGGLILVQREMSKFQLHNAPSLTTQFKVYRYYNPNGMSLAGLRELVARHLLGGVPAIGKLKMSTPNLNDREVGYEKLTWNFPKP